MATFNKDLKIGIIGAGPAGLAAAEALKELGYKNYIVLEKLNRAGGMSLSFTYPTLDGEELVYELGSFSPTSSKKLFQLIKKNNLHIGKKNLGREADPKKPMKIKMYSLQHHQAEIDFVRYFFGYPVSKVISLLPQIARFLFNLLRNYQLIYPGFNQLDLKKMVELSVDFESWLDKMNFKELDLPLRMMGTIATFSNPSPRYQIPLMHNIKMYLNLLKPPIRYLNGQTKYIKEGYQELWNRVAKNNPIIFNAHILNITRKLNKVEVKLENEEIVFDKIIITCSLTETLQFLDATKDEIEIFKKVRYSPGWRAAFLAKNLPHDGLYIFIEPYLSTNEDWKCPGLQSFYPEGQVDDEVWLYSSALNSDQNENIEFLLHESEKRLKNEFCAKDIQWLNKCYWPEYSPGFFPSDIKNGIFQKLENLQGLNHTYYLGGVLSGTSHAIVVEYSYDRIKKFFG